MLRKTAERTRSPSTRDSRLRVFPSLRIGRGSERSRRRSRSPVIGNRGCVRCAIRSSNEGGDRVRRGDDRKGRCRTLDLSANPGPGAGPPCHRTPAGGQEIVRHGSLSFFVRIHEREKRRLHHAGGIDLLYQRASQQQPVEGKRQPDCEQRNPLFNHERSISPSLRRRSHESQASQDRRILHGSSPRPGKGVGGSLQRPRADLHLRASDPQRAGHEAP